LPVQYFTGIYIGRKTVHPQGEKHVHKDYSKEDIKHESKVNMSLFVIGSCSCHQA